MKKSTKLGMPINGLVKIGELIDKLGQLHFSGGCGAVRYVTAKTTISTGEGMGWSSVFS